MESEFKINVFFEEEGQDLKNIVEEILISQVCENDILHNCFI